MTHRRMLLAAVLAGASLLAAPAASHAATATVTGDDGTALDLSSPVSIRQMKPQVTPAFAADERRYTLTVTGPGGRPAAVGTTCGRTSTAQPEQVRYQGNGTYTVTIRTSPDLGDTTCQQAGPVQSFAFTIAASSAVSPPGLTLATRRPGEFAAIQHPFSVAVNPGADTVELRYAAGVTLDEAGGLAAPDGGERAPVDLATGTALVTFARPGTYTLVARAASFSGDTPGPWSPPVTVRVVSPFDFVGQPSFSDSRGPKYRMRGTVREPSAKGQTIVISVRRGTKARFRRIAKVRIRKGGRFAFGFTLRRQGRYQLRYSFRGSDTVAGGSFIQGIRISRRPF